MFDLMINGVGDAFSRHHWGTNFLCRKDGFVLAVDCPDSYRRALKDNAFDHEGTLLDAQHIDGLFLTHLHGDHVNGLEMLLAYRKFVAGGKLDLWTTPEVTDVLWEKRLKVSLGTMFDGEYYNGMHLDDYVGLEDVPWGTPVEIGPFTVQTRRTIHHIPTAGLRISDGEHVLGYSCDTAWDPDHIEWLSDADLIIHETSLGPAHTPLHRLEELPQPIRDKLLVIHYPDSLIPGDDGLAFAKEGAEIVVGAGRLL